MNCPPEVVLQTAIARRPYARAIIVHNAARLGSMEQRAAAMEDAHELQTQLNVNVVSAMVLNSVFLRVYAAVPCKRVVNMTAPSASR